MTPAVGSTLSQVAPEVVNGNGTVKIISISLISLTFVALILQIRASKKSIKAHEKQEAEFEKKFSELEYNVKNALGTRYTVVT